MTPAGNGVVGLSVGGPRPPELDELIHVIGRQYTVVNADGHQGPIDWMLVFRSPVAIRDDIPAVWYLLDSADVGQLRRPSLLLSADPELLAARGTKSPKLLMPRVALADDPGRPYGPYPRDRIRRARGLPAQVIGEVMAAEQRWNGYPVGAHLRDTIMVAASAVIADQSSVLTGLAYGAPTVTDPQTALSIGAQPGEQLLVGNDLDERRRLAAELAADPATAARLSWAGRTLFENSHSWPHLVQRIAHAVAPVVGPGDRINRVLDALGTPAAAPIRARAHQRYQLPISMTLTATEGKQ